MEDYLKAIYTLQRKNNSSVSTSEIAEYLDVTSPTVTNMLENLKEKGLIEYEKYKGARLTDEGLTIALEVIRHHRLIESYLTEHLDYEWSQVHDEADKLEHHISEEFEQKIAKKLNNPTVDPHGDPIPNEKLEPLEEDDTKSLTSFKEGEKITVARVDDRNQEELEYLSSIGIKPGQKLKITNITPIGLIKIQTENGKQHLPEKIAKSIRVRQNNKIQN